MQVINNRQKRELLLNSRFPQKQNPSHDEQLQELRFNENRWAWLTLARHRLKRERWTDEAHGRSGDI